MSLKKLADFITIVYIPYFLKTSLVIQTPGIDVSLLNTMRKLKTEKFKYAYLSEDILFKARKEYRKTKLPKLRGCFELESYVGPDS